MSDYQLKISGVHYAANSDSVAGQKDTEEMHLRTRKLLSWIDHDRPMVVLTAEPTNHYNSNAIMARAQGRRIGRVGDECLTVAHALLKQSGQPMILAKIKEVAIRNHGYVVVTVSTEAPATLQPLALTEIEWRNWMSDLPLLPPAEQLLSEQEAGFVLDTVVFPKLEETDFALLKTYLDIWIEGSQHDLSREARRARSVYIERLEAAQKKEVRQLAELLREQQTSICGRKALDEHTAWLRTEWQRSADAVRLWNQWRLKNDNKLWLGLRRLDLLLRELPGELYGDIGKLDVVLSRLYYMNTPSKALQAILTLLMLRELTCLELGIVVQPMTEEDYQTDGYISNPIDMPTTIGRVVEFGQTQCELPIQRQTIQMLAQWLRDDYEQSHSKEIEALAENRRNKLITTLEREAAKPHINISMEFVQNKETNIDKNYGPNIEQTGGMLNLPENN